MRRIKLIIFSFIFIILLLPTLISAPFAYSYLTIDWDTQAVISNDNDVCEQTDQECIDRDLRLDIATPIFALISFLFFCAIGSILLVYTIWYIWWMRKTYFIKEHG